MNIRTYNFLIELTTALVKGDALSVVYVLILYALQKFARNIEGR